MTIQNGLTRIIGIPPWEESECDKNIWGNNVPNLSEFGERQIWELENSTNFK